MDVVIGVEDVSDADVVSLLETHLAFAQLVTPPGLVHALDASGLDAPDVTLFGARRAGDLLGVAALRELDALHGELKSMHTIESARRVGVGRSLVDHVMMVARDRGLERLSLETGTYEAFASARRLYASLGFTECPPFGSYTAIPDSVCMTLRLA